MEEGIIGFDTAKLAKEKGFDKKGYNFYQIEGEIFINEIEAAKVNSHYYCRMPSFELYRNHNKNSLWCSAPTQSLLQKWLREVHKIDIEVNKEKEGLYFAFKNDLIKTQIGEGDTYEIALEIGLQEGLKLIKI